MSTPNGIRAESVRNRLASIDVRNGTSNHAKNSGAALPASHRYLAPAPRSPRHPAVPDAACNAFGEIDGWLP